jgi:hypothetical protein
MKTRPIHLFLMLPMMSGCASIERSSLLGAASGGALGTGIGIANEKSVGSALIGLGIGAIVGGAIGFVAHKNQESKRGELLNPVLTKDFKDKVPAISTPEVRRVWVPEKIEGNKYIDGHYIYVIDRQAVWGK